MISLIVAVDKNWGIGHRGNLLLSIPADMKFFKETTTGNVVVMGRKTLESFPGGRPLTDRINIVITKKKDYKVNGAIIVHSVEEALEEAKKYTDLDTYVIGGGLIYNQMLKYCDEAHVTYIDYSYEADTYFPNLDTMPDWVIEGESEEQTHFNLVYYFRKYVRKR